MKTINKKIMGKNLLNIKLRTVPNGYVLDIEKKSYMYYNLSELLDGFIYHIGLGELDEVDDETRRNIIAASVTWKENGSSAKELLSYKEKCERLERSNEILKKQADKAKKIINGSKGKRNEDESDE